MRGVTFLALIGAVSATNFTACTEHQNCREFGDTTATCTSDLACACTSTDDDSALCYGSFNETTLAVTYVLRWNYDCATFAGDSSLADAIRTAVTSTQTTYSENVTTDIVTSFTCGSQNALLAVTAEVAALSTLGDALTTNIDTALSGTGMDGTRLSSTMTTVSSTATCDAPSYPVKTLVYLSKNNCVADTCWTGYSIVADEDTGYVRTCQADDDDDELSDGAIAAIVVGSVLLTVVVIAILVLARSGPATPMAKEEPADLPEETKEEA